MIERSSVQSFGRQAAKSFSDSTNQSWMAPVGRSELRSRRFALALSNTGEKKRCRLLRGFVLLAALATVGCPSARSVPDADKQSPPKGDHHRAAARFSAEMKEKYGISVVISSTDVFLDTAFGAITGKQATSTDVERFVTLIEPEWNLYPPSLLRKCNLRRIILCDDLHDGGQQRGGVTDLARNDLYLDVTRSMHDTLYVCCCLHHEIYHFIDWSDDKEIHQDFEWTALLEAGTTYGSGGSNMREGEQVFLSHPRRGFLNKYSTSAVEEDKAEMFAMLIAFYPAVEDLAKKDEIIAAKMERMLQTLEEFCPEMNHDFWKRTRQVRRAGRT